LRRAATAQARFAILPAARSPLAEFKRPTKKEASMSRRSRFDNQVCVLSVLVLGAGPAAAAALDLPPGADAAAQQIAPGVLAGAVRYLSDDLLEGRGPASRGDELARAYIASQFEQIGLEPGAADGSWQQEFDVVGITTQVPKTWSFAAKGGGLDLAFWDEFIAVAGEQAEATRIDDAELVFVGYGMSAPEYGWEDYKTDVRGKIVVIVNNDPDWDDKLFAGKLRLYYGRWDYKYENAARHGAAGAIIIHTTPSAGYGWQVVQSSWTGEQFELPAGGEPRLRVSGWVTEAAAAKLVRLGGQDLAKLVSAAKKRSFKPVSLATRTSIAFGNTITRKRTANVLGLLRGSDARLRDEVVVYTAHHDHLGVGEPDSTGDRIYNGALDNAAGVAQVLAIARAFKALPQPPRRTILFLAVGVEESGLLGSLHYARNPTFPPGRIAANINYDGAAIWGRSRDIVLIGKGKSSLDAVAEAAAATQDRIVVPDQFPDRGHFYRSDQFNFARIGVPALYFDAGVQQLGRPPGWGKQQMELWEARNYHQASDELDASWNFEGIVEDARIGFLCGASIATSEAMPRWNVGDEFEAARKAALQAIGASGGAE
jgi:Zn-dependent M28 family amino/carboxypeptidase